MTKDEKKDEMKNRISMALKDPILQQGFEIICKNLTELEKKIADIKANCDLAIEGRDVKIKELEQENNKLLDVINNQDVKIADLEQQIEKMKCCGNCKHFDKLYNRCELTRLTLKSCLCNALDKWELRR